MAQKSTPPVGPSSEMWGRLEVFVREPIQRFIQTLLEEEVTACLGCPKAARRGAVDAPAGMRNGYGRPRRLSLTAGTITVRRPRVRGLHERFVRRVLPLFKRRTREVGERLPAAAEPRCGHHRITNVLDAVPRKYQAEARTLLRAMPYADMQAACEELRAPCDHRYRQLAPKAVERLGAPRHLLSVPAGTLAPPTDHECRRIALCGGATVHHSGQTLQEGGHRHGDDLESPPDRGDHVPAVEGAGDTAGGVCRCDVWRWHQADRCQPPGNRRLIPFPHFLTRPRSSTTAT